MMCSMNFRVFLVYYFLWKLKFGGKFNATLKPEWGFCDETCDQEEHPHTTMPMTTTTHDCTGSLSFMSNEPKVSNKNKNLLPLKWTLLIMHSTEFPTVIMTSHFNLLYFKYIDVKASIMDVNLFWVLQLKKLLLMKKIEMHDL